MSNKPKKPKKSKDGKKEKKKKKEKKEEDTSVPLYPHDWGGGCGLADTIRNGG